MFGTCTSDLYSSDWSFFFFFFFFFEVLFMTSEKEESNWATSWENVFIPYANNKGTDQPAHPRSLISAFVVRCLDSIIHLVSIFEISRLRHSLLLSRLVWVYLVGNPEDKFSRDEAPFFCFKWTRVDKNAMNGAFGDCWMRKPYMLAHSGLRNSWKLLPYPFNL